MWYLIGSVFEVDYFEAEEVRPVHMVSMFTLLVGEYGVASKEEY